ncbi:class I adenylate cyclase [Salinivibrio sp. IB643]|uniref:class I adenylate cyclase n=1 Tax=Salinivibrio sp. IB643 TaxID=1909445 RepID=UPI000988FA3E|nr:class I adenylate cyclase [Salinivibrio sp. IB643]OOE96385.1 adenylate cyclase [Salinivibrio sp. IB643]
MIALQTYVQQQTERIEAFNRVRMDRARSAMSRQAQAIFDVLPVLLHLNHPALPGFCGDSVPFGIADYQLDETQREFVSDCLIHSKTRFSSLTACVDERRRHPIKGMYTMGSTGSMGQSLTSDLDIWVCIDAAVTTAQRDKLDAKCMAISEWALNQGVEANFFLVCEGRFRHHLSQTMTSDNCGTSQHFLLLDEFYRSSMRVAGQKLLWYMVPPEMEGCYDDYVDTLVADHGLDRRDWVDFGGLPTIPAEEYFGSSLWQLYKSIDSPYKSVLKAILLEAYSWQYPGTQLLSVDGKRRFYAGWVDVYQSDAYYLMLEKVTRYLESIGDARRLDLVRRCFYLKTHEKLTQSPSTGSVAWRRDVLRLLAHEWGWDEQALTYLDNRRHWKVEEVQYAHNELLDALMQSYRNLIRFARRNDITSAISPQDISTLARKLYAAFEELPGKVTLLNPQISPDLHEPNLTLIQVPEGRTNRPGWYLYKHSLDPVDIIGRAPLAHNSYLSKLIAWAFFNGLLTESTHLHTVVRDADVDIDILYQLVSDIRNTFSLRPPRPTLDALSSPCEIRQLALFINLEQDPTSAYKKPSMRFDFKNSDIFSYGPEQTCLVGSVDLVYRNSWNEIRTLNYRGDDAILEALKTMLGKMHQDAVPPESVDVFCYSSKMRGLIRNLVYQLVAECIELRLKPVEKEKRRRFKALRIGLQTHGLFFERRGVSVQRLENSVDFYRCISTNKVNGTPVMVVDNPQDVHPPAVVDAYASEGLVQFFFEDCANGYNLYILDESNRVEVYRQCSGDKTEMVQGVNRFYTSSHDRYSYSANFINFNLPQFYQIVTDDRGEPQALPFKCDTQWQPPRQPPHDGFSGQVASFK